EVLQAVVPKNVIFGSSIEENGDFAVVSCMVSPGFDFKDFELFTQAELLLNYPKHQEIIKKLAYKELPIN
ncbi:cupin domain-containing protein, partial [Carnobacterium sp.]